MKKIFLAIVCFAALTISAAAQDRYVTEDRNVGSFKGVKASMGIDVKIVYGKKHSVTVEASEQYLLERTETYVKNGILHVQYSVKFSNNNFNGHNVVYVYAPEYREITATMGSDVEIESIKSDYLKITATMGSSLSGKLNAKTVEIASKMGADISLSGKADICIAKASGGSDLDLRNFRCREVDVQAGGGSDAEVCATGKLDARASGGSDIRYYGNPEIRNIRGSASSDVVKAE